LETGTHIAEWKALTELGLEDRFMKSIHRPRLFGRNPESFKAWERRKKKRKCEGRNSEEPRTVRRGFVSNKDTSVA